MTLKELIESDVADVFMNTADFGETVTYSPAGGGGSRTLVAIVDEGGTFQSDETGLGQTEVIHVTVSRNRSDETTDGVAVGGIDDPQIGDCIRRENDPEDKGYAYSGDKEDVDEFCWTLIYKRSFVLQHGGGRQTHR